MKLLFLFLFALITPLRGQDINMTTHVDYLFQVENRPEEKEGLQCNMNWQATREVLDDEGGVVRVHAAAAVVRILLSQTSEQNGGQSQTDS